MLVEPKLLSFFDPLRTDLRTDDSDWKWDPRSPMGSAAALISYVARHNNMDGALVAFELGNEPDLAHYAYNVTLRAGTFPISPARYAADFSTLRRVLAEAYPAGNAPLVIGPSVANAGPTGGGLFWRQFFANASAGRVDGASYHHYYGAAKKATTANAHSPSLLDGSSVSIPAWPRTWRRRRRQAHRSGWTRRPLSTAAAPRLSPIALSPDLPGSTSSARPQDSGRT